MPIRQLDARIAARLAGGGVRPRDELIVVHVSAGNPFRRWPEEASSALVRRLAASGVAPAADLSSGPSDRGAAERIARGARAELGSGAPPRSRFRRFRPAELRALVATKPAVRRRRYRPASYRGDDGNARRRHFRTDAAGALGAVARPGCTRPPSIGVDGLPCRPCDQRAACQATSAASPRSRPDVVLCSGRRAAETDGMNGMTRSPSRLENAALRDDAGVCRDRRSSRLRRRRSCWR